MNPSDHTPYIYADNAATTPLSPRALEAMMPHLTCAYGNPSGIHRLSREAALALAQARNTTAQALGAQSAGEIYFTSGGSESDNWVLRGAARRHVDLYGPHATPHIVTSSIEHHAVLHCCEALEAEGVRVTYLPVDDRGLVDPRDLEAALAGHDARMGSNRAPVALVSIMLANNEVGTVQPIAELARIAHAHGAPFHTDAVQAVGHIPVDVHALGVDALSFSAHKFHGPRGVGALYLREGFSIPPLIAGGAQERGERAGTENLAGIAGMAAALEEAREGLEGKAARVAAMRDELVDRLSQEIEGLHLTGAHLEAGPAGRLPSIASFVIDGVEGELLVVLLDRMGVAAATGSACSTGSTEPSHVLTAMGVPARSARGALRLSLADDVTERDIDLLCERIPVAIRRARLVHA